MSFRTALALLLPFAALPPASAEPPVKASELLAHVKRLASDEWEGRATGSAGERKATGYIRDHLASLGLQPAGEGGTWFQRVEMPAGHEVKKETNFTLKGEAKAERAFDLGKDFTALSVSSDGIAEGEPVFAGYGVTVPGRYDDYAGADVRGKVVFVFRHAPGGDRAWNQAVLPHAAFGAKAEAAAKQGAIALVVLNDPANFTRPVGRGNRPRPDALQNGGVGEASSIPVLHVTLAASRALLPALFGATPEELETRIRNGDGPPRPVFLPGRGRVRVQASLERKTIEGRNVCGLLRSKSKEPLDGVLVIGAHHDHLGRGLWGSLERDPKARREIHNGADDNASGTSGLLEVAEYLASRRDSLRRDVLFLTFTGEERGLVGSRYWCDQPTVPLERIVAMINMDMIGRLDGRQLFVGGTGTSPVWEPLLKGLVDGTGIDTVFGPGGRAPSDNTSFYAKGIPVLFFFTGLHEQYHRPDDDWERIDIEAMEKVAALVARTAEETANLATRPEFRKADQGGSGPPRPVLGISLGRGEGGVAVGGVAPDGPAARAGMEPGDLILAVDGKPTPGLGALRSILQSCRIGQKIKVKFRRGDTEREVEIELGAS